jgi:aromatase
MSALAQAEHVAEFHGRAERGYQLIADVTRWPVLFGPCVAAKVLEKSATDERIRLWGLAGDQVRSWTSWRGFDPGQLRVDFRQEEPSPPVTAMSGRWEFTPAEGARPARLVLSHAWSSADPADSAAIADALDRNSNAEVGAISTWAERAEDPEELVFSFTDRVDMRGDPAVVYDFLARADLWPGRIGHVRDLGLDEAVEPVGGGRVQVMDMLTAGGDGSTHSTRSVRLCFPGERIVYKQTVVPRGMLGHAGEWVIVGAEGGTTVTARHTVALDPAAVGDVFGPGTPLGEAKRLAQGLLSRNSRLTLEAAARFIEETA